MSTNGTTMFTSAITNRWPYWRGERLPGEQHDRPQEDRGEDEPAGDERERRDGLEPDLDPQVGRAPEESEGEEQGPDDGVGVALHQRMVARRWPRLVVQSTLNIGYQFGVLPQSCASDHAQRSPATRREVSDFCGGSRWWRSSKTSRRDARNAAASASPWARHIGLLRPPIAT